MTLATSKRIYIAAGGNDSHLDSEWDAIHKEMKAVVAAKSDRAAANVIRWWGCWTPKYTATQFARRVRQAYAKELNAP